MPASYRPRQVALTSSLLLALTFAAPGDAFAHAAFVGATPTPGARTEASPRQVTLTFTEPVNGRLTSVELESVASGAKVATTLSTQGGSQLVAKPKTGLDTGAYRVDWHTVSTEDGHALEGRFSFGVRVAAAGGELTVEQSPLARGGWMRVLLRGLLYVGALLFVGALVLPILMRRPRDWIVPDGLGDDAFVEANRERARAIVGDVGWFAASAAAAATLVEAANAAPSFSPGALRDFLLANAAGVARLGVVVCLAIAALVWQRFPRLAAGLGLLGLGAIGASGHANSASPQLLSVLNAWLHLASGATWLGGIGLLALVWARPVRRADRTLRLAVARDVLVPFGRVALPAFAVVSATGLVSLLIQLGSISALWQTTYGVLLTTKIAIVAAIAAVSAVHALRLRPQLLAASAGGEDADRRDRRHWRLVRAEPLMGLGVVAAVAFLVAFPLPPRQLAEADEAQAAAPVCDPCPLPVPAQDELPVATRAGSQLVAAWVRRTPDAVTGTVRVGDIRGKPSREAPRINGATQTPCGDGCQRFRTGPKGDALRVTVTERGRTYTAALTTRWRPDANAQARSLLLEAQAVMRRLRSVREVEEVTSGPGSYARTDYRVQAPDRLAFRTNRGVETVIAGDRQWFRAGPGPWQLSAYGSGQPFATRRWFRWSTYGRSVRLLGINRREGRRVADLALFDEGTPVWFRLMVDLDSRRVLQEQMTAKGHFMNAHYQGFDQPLTIAQPEAGARGG